MSWWKSTPTARDIQITSLEKSFPEAKKVVQDRDKSCHYDLEFQRQGTPPKVTLRIFLPRKFPDDKPILVLMNDIQHAWINQYNQVIGHVYWNSWKKDMDICYVIREVIFELKKTDPPPIPRQQLSPTPSSTSNISPALSLTNNNVITEPPPEYQTAASSQLPLPPPLPQQEQSQQAEQEIVKDEVVQKEESFEIPLPPIPKSFDELESFSIDKLEDLYNNEAELHEFINNLIGIKTIQEMQSDALHSNFKFASKNLIRKDELNNIRNEVQTLQAELRQIKAKFDSKLNDYVEKEKNRLSDVAILGNMRKSASEFENASELLHEKFCRKEMEVGEFVKEYQELRRKFHRVTASAELHRSWAL